MAEARLENNRDVVGIPGITPAQGVFIAMFRRSSQPMIDALRDAGRRVFSSPEMREVCTDLTELNEDDYVELD